MDVIKVQRKATTANAELKFQFDNTGLEFLVKNFTEDDIYVGFKAGESKEKRILIPAGTAQVVAGMAIRGSDTVYVLPMATHGKGVEVQCLSW